MTNTNLRIWDAVSKTDPSHTKKVTFGRTFTSIDAHWQVMQATKQFGPIGEGWGYTVEHSTLTLTPEMILAVADVTLWWLNRIGDGPSGERCEYGPVRGTCEMYGPKTSQGKPIPGMFVTDEDAPKKAMTDALTKGLSHLGFSADVFLGLFDDNRYVQKVTKEFANGNGNGPPPPSVPEEDRGLLKNPDDPRSTYQIAAADKSPGRTQAELLASLALGVLQTPGMDLVTYNAWKAEKCTNKGTKTYGDRLAELHEKHPDLAQKIDEAVDSLRVAA